MNFYSVFEINDRIRETFHDKGLKLRFAGNGLWLCSLLPVALLCNVCRFHKYSELYKIISVVGIGQFVCAISNILHNTNPDIPFEPIGVLFSSTIVSLLLVFCTDRSVILLLSLAVLSSLSYSKIFQILIEKCPRSFTYGEGALVTQAIVLYLSSFGTNLILLWFGSSTKRCDETATLILQAGFFAILIVLVTACKFHDLMKNSLVFLLALCSASGVLVLGVPFFVMRKNSLLWLFQLVNDQKSIALIVFWVICCLAAVYCLFQQCNNSKPATSAFRKSFHFLLFIVLLPGLTMLPCLMYFAGGVAFGLLIIIETARKLKLTTHAKILQSCFEAFKDEKDEGELALTPLYLMVGCIAPVWLYPFSYSKFIPLPILAGLLPVAIGDAMASIGGTWLGRHRWPRSSKTIEGTCFCFLSQLFTMLLLDYLGFLRLRSVLWTSCVFVIISLFEAQTDQIDNLVLPFISYTLFCFITYFSFAGQDEYIERFCDIRK